MLGSLAGHDRAGRAARRGADRRAGAAAGDAADDRAEPGAAGHLPRRSSCLRPPPFDSTCVVTMSYFRPPNAIEFAFSVILSAPFILPACSTFAACRTTAAPRGTIDLAADHHRIVEQRLERHAGLRGVDVDRLGEPDVQHGARRHVIGAGACAGSGAGGGRRLARRELQCGDVVDRELRDPSRWPGARGRP